VKLDFFVKIKYQSSTKILSDDVKYSVRDLLCDVNTMFDPQSSDMRHMPTVNDVSAPYGINSP